MTLKDDLQTRKKQHIISFAINEEKLNKLDQGQPIETNYKGHKFTLQQKR